jgi:hypothetical protein
MRTAPNGITRISWRASFKGCVCFYAGFALSTFSLDALNILRTALSMRLASVLPGK